ncbi:hypothetical protein FACS1894166_01260 [Bacilli bacterium]|nr:hypothetical protein FACS1894166_01260 [Bacilli bacterium]
MKRFTKNQIISLCVGSILAATVVSITGVVVAQAVTGKGIFEDRRVDIAFESGSNRLSYGETDIIKASVKNVKGNCE